jgi:signal transduction histidine kinase
MNKFWVRLSLAFLLITWLAIGAVAIIVGYATETSFRHYISGQNTVQFSDGVIEHLQEYYLTSGGWEGAEELLPGQGSGKSSGGRGGQGSQSIIVDLTGTIVVSSEPSLVGSVWDDGVEKNSIPLIVDNIQVGWLGQQRPAVLALGEAETNFLNDATQWLAITAVGAGILAVLFGGALAWGLTSPLRTLTSTVTDFTVDKLGVQVEERGTQEMKSLAHAFNIMSHDLAEGEQLRQRMAADIAHELRTPVSVLRGHLEAMLDGVFPLDDAHLAVAYDQTLHLSRLVADLRLLTLAETGRLPLERTVIEPGLLVTKAIDRFKPLALDAGTTLTQGITPGLPSVCVDIDRVQQVFGNLLANALRHTPKQGLITIKVMQHEDKIRFTISNTGGELSAEQAKYIFKRFWRAEDSRERDSGGSGLGLAISRQLVVLHKGRIWAEVEAEQTTFTVELPVV